jgi:hypothetical protein
MERETGIEPVTSSLGSWRSTAELLPLNAFDFSSGSETCKGPMQRDAPEGAQQVCPMCMGSEKKSTGRVVLAGKRLEGLTLPILAPGSLQVKQLSVGFVVPFQESKFCYENGTA